MKLKQFFEKYNKQMFIIFFVLFTFKSFQSCNRQLEVSTQKAKMELLQDSLSSIIQTKDDTIHAVKARLDLANVYKEAANVRADAVQSVAEKITKNTTVKVEK